MTTMNENNMKHYEMLYIITGKYSENELAPALDKVKSLIEEKDGKITYSEVWGKKKFTYPIKGLAYGYYFLHEFDADSQRIKEIENAFRIVPDMVRFQIVRKELITEAARIKKTEEVKEGVKKSMREEIEITETKVQKAKKVDLKDLDEKLDKILDVDGLL